MSNIKSVPDNGSEERKVKKAVLEIPIDLLEEAEINLDDLILFECGDSELIVSSYNVLDGLPVELLELYDSLGYSLQMVKETLEREFILNSEK